MSARRTLAVVLAAAVSIAWLDPHAKAREAARLYADGKYDDAVTRYNEALTDEPDSALLHFNLGDAAYKQGKHDDALNAFQQVPPSDADPARTAAVAYNVGTVKYRLGEAAATSEPQKALGLWGEALAAYRRALGAAPDDTDAKFNHEFVEKKIAELRKKLEDEQKEKEQQQQEQQEKQDEQQPQDQQQQGEQKPEDQQQEKKQDEQQQAGEDQKQEEQQKQEQQAEEQRQKEQQQAEQNAPQPAGGGERKDGEMTRQEAAAVLDSQRDQELQPEEMTKRMQGAVVGEPAEDW